MEDFPATAAFPFADNAAPRAAPALDFAAVYREHFAFVWRNLRRLRVAEEALDDAAQEVFLVVHRRLSEFEGRSSLKTWLFGILLNTARHHRRARARRQDPEPLRESVPDTERPGPLESAARAEAVALLHRFLDDLDDDLRVPFVMTRLEQLSAPEVALATGVNVHTIHSRLRAAEKLFEQAVARHHARARWSAR
ncbi:MAG: sigma-70 family RNA polymerase sigma factor [Deltaproteobacteria bacterium]|nr:sigma-70 family RNA polymerase sigma factor [Deltaproteobacteria bacterium]